MFEWEESTFLGLKSLYQRFLVNPTLRDQEARRASLVDHRSSLVLLARMLSGQNLGIFETEDAILCTRDRICLPPHFHEAKTPEGNLHLYELKTILAALAHRDQWRGPLTEFPAALGQEFPHLAEKISRTEDDLIPDDELTLWEILGEAVDQGTNSGELQETPVPGEQEASSAEITTEIEGRGQMDVEVLATPEDDLEGSDMPIHTFEKAECLEETSGLNRKKDDDDELEEHEEALKEVNMKELIRSQERPRSIYRSDIILDGLNLEISDEAGDGIPYPEWDYRKRRYKNDWCHLQQTHNQKEHPGWIKDTEQKHRALIATLKRQFATITSEFLRLKRQPFGSDFDLDAVVDSQVQLRAGQTPGESIYLNQKKDIHDVSALLLLDLSFSTDAWVKDARVLDSIMETVYCVGEVINESIESFGVAGFSSNTRRSCRFEMLKDFQESWHEAKLHFGALQPQGYTRIGPALRHAQELLLNQPASRKIVILVTDGRPCDYDRYEGEYGIRDVRKAIEVGKLHGISTHAFAIEKQASETFPLMFTRHHFDVVQSPTQLTERMSKLFSRLITT
ncbi:VWA domain-containing protein [Verrucomicrobiaceae bacterium 227]